MKILGIDTATWTASVGLSRDGIRVAEQALVTRGAHGLSLLPMIEQTLAAAGWAIGDLDGIAVSLGPGSFTGLRIGLASAKGLAFAAGIPLAGVRTLVALAASSGVRDGLVSAVLDARRGEVYAALVQMQGGVPEVLHPEVAVTLERWLGVIEDRPCTFIGDGVYLIDPVERPGWTLLPYETHHADGAVVARLGEQRLLAGDAAVLAELEPLYCRPSEAELRAV